MSKIVAIRKGYNGTVEMFKLDNGLILNYDQAVEAVRNRTITGCNIGKDKNGYDTVKSNNDGDYDNNLSMLLEF